MQNEFDSPDEWEEEEPYYDWDDPDWREDWADADDEIMAIPWHMSGGDLAFQSPEIRNNYNEASGKCPLLAVLKAADGLASHVLGT